MGRLQGGMCRGDKVGAEKEAGEMNSQEGKQLESIQVHDIFEKYRGTQIGYMGKEKEQSKEAGKKGKDQP